MGLESLTCMFVKPKRNLKELMSFKLTISSTKSPSCSSAFLSRTSQLVQLLRSSRSISQLPVKEKSIESTWSKGLSKHLSILKSKISVKWQKILQEMCSSKVSMLFMWSIAIQRKWDPFEMKRSLTKKLKKRKKLSKFKLILLIRMDLKTSLSFSLFFWNQLSIFNWMVIQIKENLILWIQLATTTGKISSLAEAKTLDKIHSSSSKVSSLSNQDTKTGMSTKILKETSSNSMANSFKTSSIWTETALILLLLNISTKFSSLKCKLTNPCLWMLSSNSKLP